LFVLRDIVYIFVTCRPQDAKEHFLLEYKLVHKLKNPELLKTALGHLALNEEMMQTHVRSSKHTEERWDNNLTTLYNEACTDPDARS
jgi:hypothetical protein